ncbi:unnamed protein product [Rotaria magnacalcarata]|uniref:Immunoglobulin V-set domain-containing protein n=1 Tax=Rotaria magnacalcarata TaxID=392030 RepID=A0A8S2NN18_9BILA|nr:unnamed protein product [Rotaria magnacalcarata]
MECKHQTATAVTAVRQSTLASLLFSIVMILLIGNHYHLTRMIERDNREHWNLEIRNVHLSDQGYYSCVLTEIKPISKIFHVKVLELTRNPLLALRSTSDAYTNNVQRRSKDDRFSSLSLLSSSILTIFLMNILLIII